MEPYGADIPDDEVAELFMDDPEDEEENDVESDGDVLMNCGLHMILMMMEMDGLK